MQQIPVAVLGATGMVGQRFIELLADHPWFRLVAVTGSERRTGSGAPIRYGDAVTWRLTTPPPAAALDLPLLGPSAEFDAPVVFSALPTEEARELEPFFAARGHAVFSNASSYRMDEDVPLLIPEVNPEHLNLLVTQRARRGWRGYLVTNPNCSTIGIVLALKPLHDAFGVRQMQVTTLQAVSGAGYPGVASMDILDNVIPYIGQEEEKIERETRKLLGQASDGVVIPAEIAISAQCTRVAVRDGHLATVSVALTQAATPAEVIATLREFRAAPQVMGLPSAPDPVVIVRDEVDRPQPVRDRDAGKGMAIVVGRVRPCPLFGIKFVALSHNTIRGAAGASLLNAEYLHAKGSLLP